MKPVAETTWKQHKFKEGWVWYFLQSFSMISHWYLWEFLNCSFNFCEHCYQIVTKSHSTPILNILHVLIYVLFMSTQSCGTSYSPNLGGRKIIRSISMRNNKCVPVCASDTQTSDQTKGSKDRGEVTDVWFISASQQANSMWKPANTTTVCVCVCVCLKEISVSLNLESCRICVCVFC